MRLELDVNGQVHTVEDVAVWESLLTVLRDRLALYGSKNACEQGECGSCSVLVDGEVVCSCLVLAGQAEGRSVVTVEGLDADPIATEVRCALVAAGGVQCGFCTPGFVVTATGLLRDQPCASEPAVREALAGNLCRCTGYSKIVEAIARAQAELGR
ncbi:(2Fe-2S)-binding protein [Nocardioides ginsengisoli]|uniref:(2Fe-2S)-binding protein n=1 Tax=Nocardioides ginsengisoli TaxID=363868 RepID=A0ABW3W729_9ACTN